MRLPRSLVRAAAWIRPQVPQQLLRLLLSTESFLSKDAPLVVLPAFERALAIAPHPDDETIGAGGTIARLARAGAEVWIVVVTDGEATIGSPHDAPETARRRRAEVATACRRLGAQPPRFLSIPDGQVSDHLDQLATHLQHEVSAHAPQVVFTPWPLERHPDHRACTTALAQLPPRDTELWGYEAHTPIPLPDRVIDIGADVAAKQAALAAHVTAARAFNLDACLGLARWRALSTDAGYGAAEAFLTLPWEELPRLTAAAARAWQLNSPVTWLSLGASRSARAGTIPEQIQEPAARESRDLLLFRRWADLRNLRAMQR